MVEFGCYRQVYEYTNGCLFPESPNSTIAFNPVELNIMWEKTAVSFVYEYHFADVSKMIPMDIKKAQFRIEHLSGCSTVLHVQRLIWHCKHSDNIWKNKGKCVFL